MKKMLSILIVLVMCAACAIAEANDNYVPSKTTDDMTVIVATAANLPAGASFTVTTKAIEELTEEEQETVEKALQDLKAAGSAEKFFTNVVDAEGNPVDLKEMLGTDELNVYEFTVISAEDYEIEYGTASLIMQFATPYEKDSEVAVLIGIMDEKDSLNWTAFIGKVLDNEGRIETEVAPETMAAVQSGIALMAIVS